MGKMTHHQYDLELGDLKRTVERVVQNTSVWPEGKNTREQYLERFHALLSDYMEIEGLSILPNPCLVNATSNTYITFLAYKLAHIEPFKILSVLEYQKRYFRGNYYGGVRQFVGIVEFMVSNQLENLLLTDYPRTELVMQWTREIRKGKSYQIPITGAKPSSFYWVEKPDQLRKLSRLINTDQYTVTEVSFMNAINDATICKWLKEPHVCAYLIFRLKQLNKIKQKSGGKAYIKAAKNLFLDNSNDSEASIDFKNRIQEVVKNPVEKFENLRKKVDSWLEEIQK